MERTVHRSVFNWTAERLVTLQLAFFAGLSLWLYWWAFVRPADITEIYRRARPDLYFLYGAGSLVHLGLVLGFVELGLFYALAMRLAQGRHGKSTWAVVIGGTLAFAAVLMYLFPYDAADIFDYIIHGRMTAVYGVNPYTGYPNLFQDDPFYRYVAWKSDPSPYGPVWELLAALGARLGGDGIVRTVWVYKLIPGFFHLASVALVALVLRREAPHFALAGTLLLAWNPVVLYETWGNGHNDMVMVFWVLAAAVAVMRRRFTLAVLALVLATLVKFVPVLLIPAVGLVALQSLPDWRSRARFVAVTTLAAGLLAALLYLPFWEGPQVLTVLDRTALFTSTIPASVYHVLKPVLGKAEAADVVSGASLLVTLVFALWQGWRAMRSPEPDRFTRAAFYVLTFYLLVTILWFQQWYTLWVIGLAPLLRSPRLRSLAIVVGFAALSKQLAAGPLLFWPRHRFPQPWLEIFFTLGVLGIPWAYAMYVVWKERRVFRVES